jgi:hypothetical protein
MLCRTASMEEQIRQPEIRQREIRQREMRQRELYRSKIEKLQKKYSKWHEVYEYDENEMVGFVSGTRIKLWYHPKPIGLIITPDGSVREWTLCDKPWGYEPKFSVPFASEDEIEIRNRDGVTMCRYKRADERDDSEEEEDDIGELTITRLTHVLFLIGKYFVVFFNTCICSYQYEVTNIIFFT